MSDAATLSILIDVKARLEELTKANEAFRQTKEESASLGEILRAGFGIGTGIEIARRAIDLFKETLREAVVGAFDYATEVQRGSENLQMSAQGYQVFANLMRRSNGDMTLFTQAVGTNNRSLVEARSGAGAAAAAYRDLGLNAAELEAMPLEQRFEAIAKAIFSANDQQKAFSDAGAILGTRRLPTLLSALRQVAIEGYGGVAEAQVQAGEIMDKDTARRLHDAEKQLEDLKRKRTIIVAETIGGLSLINDAFKKDYWGTLWATIKGPDALAKYLAPQIPQEEEVDKKPDDSAAKALAQKQEELHNLQLQLGETQLRQQTLDSDANRTEVDKRKETIENLREEFRLRVAIIALMDQLPGDQTKSPQQNDLEKAKLFEEALRTQARIAATAASPLEDTIASHENMLERVKQEEQALAQDPRYSEVEKKKKTLDLLGQELVLTQLLINLEMDRKPNASFSQANKDAQIAKLKADIDAIQNRKTETEAKPVTAYEQSVKAYQGINDPKVNKGYMTAGEGFFSGFMNWASQAGSVGQQISASIQSTLGQTVSGISQGIYGWITGTQKWGDALRQMGAGILQTLIQTVVQIGVQHVIGEAKMTAATGAGAIARSGIRLGETVFHGIQVAFRTAAHIASEVAMTAATILNAGIRIAMVIAESIAYVVEAAVGALEAMASIPYVGPFLAVAAMAAIFSAGKSMVSNIGKGFYEGGYTGSGSPTEIAGPAHRGEYVFDAASTQRLGVGTLDAIRFSRRGPGMASASASMAAGKSAGYSPVASKPQRTIHVMTDLVTAQNMMRDPNFDNYMIRWGNRNGDRFFQKRA